MREKDYSYHGKRLLTNTSSRYIVLLRLYVDISYALDGRYSWNAFLVLSTSTSRIHPFTHTFIQRLSTIHTLMAQPLGILPKGIWYLPISGQPVWPPEPQPSLLMVLYLVVYKMILLMTSRIMVDDALLFVHCNLILIHLLFNLNTNTDVWQL